MNTDSAGIRVEMQAGVFSEVEAETEESEKAESGEEPSRKRSQATLKALKRESGDAASSEALSRQTRGAARQRSSTERSAPAKKGARTRKGSKWVRKRVKAKESRHK